MKKEENKQLAVIPTAELLSEMESLVVYAGMVFLVPLKPISVHLNVTL